MKTLNFVTPHSFTHRPPPPPPMMRSLVEKCPHPAMVIEAVDLKNHYRGLPWTFTNPHSDHALMHNFTAFEISMFNEFGKKIKPSNRLFELLECLDN